MKKVIIILLFNVGFAFGAFAQVNQEAVDSIDVLCRLIKNNVSNSHPLRSSKKDSSGYGSVYANDKNEPEFVTAYTRNNNMDKHVEWYYSDGRLVYAEQMWTDSKTGKLVNNEKCYMINGHLIRLVSNGKIIEISSEEFKETDAVLANYEQKYLASYNATINSATK